MQKAILIIIFNIILTAKGNNQVNFNNSTITFPNGFYKSMKLNRIVGDTMNLLIYENRKKGVQKFVIHYDSVSTIQNQPFKQIINIKIKAIKKMGIDFNIIKTDSLSHFVLGKSSFVGEVFLYGFVIDQLGIMEIQFYNSLGIVQSDLIAFDEMLKTIKQEHPFKYSPIDSTEINEAKKEMENSTLLLIFSSPTLIIYWIFKRFLKNNQKA